MGRWGGGGRDGIGGRSGVARFRFKVRGGTSMSPSPVEMKYPSVPKIALPIRPPLTAGSVKRALIGLMNV